MSQGFSATGQESISPIPFWQKGEKHVTSLSGKPWGVKHVTRHLMQTRGENRSKHVAGLSRQKGG